MFNGYSSSSAVTYDATWTLNDVCPDGGNPDIPGCTEPSACNYDANATLDDGSCLFDDALGVCGGDCAADTDGDGLQATGLPTKVCTNECNGRKGLGFPDQ